MRLQDRIPQDKFDKIFRPMVRSLGTKNVIIRLNEAARTAIPRQTKIKQLLPKLEILCYQQSRPKVDEEMERLWTIYFETHIEDQDRFMELSDQLNDQLDDEKMPAEEERQEAVSKTIGELADLLESFEFGAEEVEAVFRIKAFPDVLTMYLKERGIKL